MKQSRFLILSVAILLLSFSSSEAGFLFKKAVAYKAKRVVADHLGYYYLISSDKVQKVHYTDSFTQFHQRQNLGEITSVDVTNPMKTVIFYADYRAIEIVDNWMTLLREIRLDEYGYMQVNAVCGSATNGIWLYDENAAILKRIDDAGNLVRQSVSTRQSMNKVLQVASMLEKNGVLYLSDPNIGIATFDLFGNFLQLIPLKGVKHFFVQQDKLFFVQEGKMNSYQPETFQSAYISLPDSTIKDAVLLKNKLVTLSTDSVLLYSY